MFTSRLWAAAPVIAVFWFFLSRSVVTVLHKISRWPHRGSTPRSYQLAEPVEIKFNHLFSTRTHVARDYSRLPFCYSNSHEPVVDVVGYVGDDDATDSVVLVVVPDEYFFRVQRRHAGQELLESHNYEVSVRGRLWCETLCEMAYSDPESVNNLKWLIENEYHHNWVADGLPSSTFMHTRTNNGREETRWYRFGNGFPVGFVNPQDNMPYVYNHVKIRFFYHRVSKTSHHIVGFAVEPMSLRHQVQHGGTDYYGNGTRAAPQQRREYMRTCSDSINLARNELAKPQIVRLGERVLYTYDVAWEAIDVPWSKRWDEFFGDDPLRRGSVSIRYIQVINTIVLVLICSGWFGFAAFRNRRRNKSLSAGVRLAISNEIGVKGENKELSTGDDAGDDRVSIHCTDAEELHPPAYPMMYCALVGSGLQLFLVTLLFLALAISGATSEARPASFMTSALLLFCFTGTVAGYGSSRLYLALGKGQLQNQLRCTVLTALLFPGVSFFVFVVLNLALWVSGSAIAVPRGQLVLRVAAMWWCVHVPLVYLGSYLGYNCRTWTFRRRAPEEGVLAHSIYLQQQGSQLVSPSIVFLACFIPLVTLYVDNVLNSMWLSVAVTPAALLFVMGWIFRRRSESDLRSNGCTVEDVAYVLLAGIFPFLSVYAEILFILPTLWKDGHLHEYVPSMCVFLLAVLICAASAMVLSARQHVKGNGWYWNSFFGSGGGIALYTFVYSIRWFYTFTRPSPLIVTDLLYYGLMLWICFALLLIFGSVGTATCLWLLANASEKE